MSGSALNDITNEVNTDACEWITGLLPLSMFASPQGHPQSTLAERLRLTHQQQLAPQKVAKFRESVSRQTRLILPQAI